VRERERRSVFLVGVEVNRYEEEGIEIHVTGNWICLTSAGGHIVIWGGWTVPEQRVAVGPGTSGGQTAWC
jgi:hypothetical protein